MSSMLALALVSAALGVHPCPPASIGPGSLHRGGTAGAGCLLSSFQNGCRPASYTLSSFGVDTIRSETFVVERRPTGCVVSVTQSFRVVPQPSHVTGKTACKRVHRVSGDVVADRCTPVQAISLTRIPT